MSPHLVFVLILLGQQCCLSFCSFQRAFNITSSLGTDDSQGRITAVDLLDVLSGITSAKPVLLVFLYDSSHEDIVTVASRFNPSLMSVKVVFKYDGKSTTINRLLKSAADVEKVLLVLLCDNGNIVNLFRTVRRERLESHAVDWLLVVEGGEEIDVYLEDVIHEGTRVSLMRKGPGGTFDVLSARADSEGIVRFVYEGKWNIKKNDKGNASEPYLLRLAYPDNKDRYRNMGRRELIVGANDFEGFFEISTKQSHDDGRPSLLGIDGTIVETLSRALNFTYRIVRPADGYWGNPLPDGTVTGVIGMAARREVSFALCAIAVTDRRDSVVDFSYPYSMETLALFSRAPKEKNRALAVLSPFTLQVWLCLIASTVAIGPLLTLQSKTSKVLLKEKSDWGVLQYSFNMFRTFVIQGNRIRTKHWPQRIIFITWYLFCLIISALYSGMLTAVLAIPAFETPIDSLSELSRAVEDGFTIGILKDTANELLFREATEGLFRHTWDLFNHETPSESFVGRPETGISRARDTKYVFIGFQISNEIMIAKLGASKFHVGRQAFHPHGIGIACPTGVPYKETFSQVLLRMLEGGFLAKWRKDELTKISHLETGDDEESRTYAISLVHVQAAFFVVVLGCLTAAVVLALENIVYYSKCFGRS